MDAVRIVEDAAAWAVLACWLLLPSFLVHICDRKCQSFGGNRVSGDGVAYKSTA